MKHMPEHVWRSVEKRGRGHFIWRHRVLPFGIPMTLLMIVCGPWQINVGWRDVLQGRSVGFVYLATLLVLATTYGAAVFEWEDHRKTYDPKQLPSIDHDEHES